MSQPLDQQCYSRALNGVYARERAASQEAIQAKRDPRWNPQWLAGYQSQPTYQPARAEEQNAVAVITPNWLPAGETRLQEIGRLILDLNDHDMHRLSLVLDIPPVSVDAAGWKLIGDK